MLLLEKNVAISKNTTLGCNAIFEDGVINGNNY